MTELNRRQFLLATGMTIAAGAAGTLAACGGEQNPPPSIIPGSSAEIGVALSDSLFGLSEQEIDQRLALVKGLGATSFRVDFDGNLSQPKPSRSYDWQYNDPIVRSARRHHLGILATISFSPQWARNKNCADMYTCRPASTQQFADFAGAVAMRYGNDGIIGYEIWNEPNVSPDGADPEEYVWLMHNSRDAIKTQDRSAPVMIGGLAQTDTSGGAMSPIDFLRALYDGGLHHFDGLALHPYSMPLLPKNADSSNLFTQIEGAPGLSMPTILDVLRAHRDADKAIWLTEMGAPTGGTGTEATGQGPLPRWDFNNSYFSLGRQALTVEQDLTYRFHEARVVSRYVYTLMDRPDNGPADPENHYGLYFASGQPKPSAAAFRKAALRATTSTR